MKQRQHYLINIKSNQESDGRLIVAEANGNPIPFEIKRLFWVRDVIEGAKRGEHATKQTKLILIPINGQCDVEVDDGNEKCVYHMDDPAKGLYIDEMIWRTMKNFSSDCVMLAVCDHVYTPGNETYENYDEFIEALKRGE